MSTITREYDPPASAEPDPLDHYRALSNSAVAALVFGVLSLSAACAYWLLAVPVVGVIWGIVAVLQCGKHSDEYSGKPLAIVGLVLSSVMLVAGGPLVYMQEMAPVPPGYQPISYDTLQPDVNVIGQQVPPAAIDLNNKKVYIKGFIFSGSDRNRIKKFVLVRDAGTCCFGGNPKVTDRIVVTLDDASLVYTKDIARVAGVFRVSTAMAPGGIGTVFYHLDNAELR